MKGKKWHEDENSDLSDETCGFGDSNNQTFTSLVKVCIIITTTPQVEYPYIHFANEQLEAQGNSAICSRSAS